MRTRFGGPRGSRQDWSQASELSVGRGLVAAPPVVAGTAGQATRLCAGGMHQLRAARLGVEQLDLLDGGDLLPRLALAATGRGRQVANALAHGASSNMKPDSPQIASRQSISIGWEPVEVR